VAIQGDRTGREAVALDRVVAALLAIVS